MDTVDRIRRSNVMSKPKRSCDKCGSDMKLLVIGNPHHVWDVEFKPGTVLQLPAGVVVFQWTCPKCKHQRKFRNR